MTTKENTGFDSVELSGAVLIIYFVVTAIMVMIMERLGVDADRATRIAPVVMPMIITIIMTGRIAETLLRTGVTVIASVLRIVRTRPAEKEGRE